MFFCDQEGTPSRLRGVREVIKRQGLFCSLYTDRGSHYWHTPEAGGKVDKANPTQCGRATAQRGIERIPAYSPEARGRSERALRTHQDRLVRALEVAGITDMAAANRYLQETYLPAYHPSAGSGTTPRSPSYHANPDQPSSRWRDRGILDDVL